MAASVGDARSDDLLNTCMSSGEQFLLALALRARARAAAMALLEADSRSGQIDMSSATNALGAMLNRAGAQPSYCATTTATS